MNAILLRAGMRLPDHRLPGIPPGRNIRQRKLRDRTSTKRGIPGFYGAPGRFPPGNGVTFLAEDRSAKAGQQTLAARIPGHASFRTCREPTRFLHCRTPRDRIGITDDLFVIRPRSSVG